MSVFIKRLLPLFVFLFLNTALTSQAYGKDLQLHGAWLEAYDDNITYQHTHRLSDSISRLKLGVLSKFQNPRTEVSLESHVTQTFYSRYDQFNHTAFDTKLNVLWDMLARDQIRFKEYYVHDQQPRSFEDAFGIVSGHYTYDKNQIEASIQHDWNSHWQTSFRFAQEIDLYSRRDIRDSYDSKPGVGINYALDSANIVGLGYDFKYRTYSGGGNTQIHSMFGMYRRYFSKQMYWDMILGEDLARSPSGDHISGFHAQTGLTNEIDENTTTGITFTRGLGSSSYAVDILDSYQVSLDYVKHLTSRWDAGINGFYGHGRYPRLGIRDQSLGAGLGANYALTERSQIGLAYTFSDTESNMALRSYTRNYVQLTTQVYF